MAGFSSLETKKLYTRSISFAIFCANDSATRCQLVEEKIQMIYTAACSIQNSFLLKRYLVRNHLKHYIAYNESSVKPRSVSGSL